MDRDESSLARFSEKEIREYLVLKATELEDVAARDANAIIDLGKLSTLAATALDELEQRNSEKVDDNRENTLEDEQFRSGIANRLTQILDRPATRKLANRLIRHTETPLTEEEVAKNEAQSEEKRKEQIAKIGDEIEEIEVRYRPSAQSLRELKYKPNGKERNGTWLRKRIEDLQDSEANEAIFDNVEANLLANIALTVNSIDQARELTKNIYSLGIKQAMLYRLGIKKAQSGLLTTFEGLLSANETDILTNGVNSHLQLDIKPVNNLLQLLKKSRKPEVSDVEDKNEVEDLHKKDRGVLEKAAELEKQPFPPKRKLAEEDISKDFISKDIHNAVNRSKSSEYRVIESRIDAFVELHESLVKKGYSMSVWRTLDSAWHPLPHYVIAIEPRDKVNGRVMAIVESPIFGHATYAIKDNDWQGALDFSRTDVLKVTDAKSFRHTSKNHRLHINRIKDHINKFGE